MEEPGDQSETELLPNVFGARESGREGRGSLENQADEYEGAGESSGKIFEGPQMSQSPAFFL